MIPCPNMIRIPTVEYYKQRTDVELCVSNIDSQSNQEDNFKVHDTIQKRAFIKIK